MSIESYCSQCYARHGNRVSCDAQKDQYDTRYQKQPTRAAHKEKPYGSPAVAESPKMWGAILSPIGMKRNWDLSNFCAVETGLRSEERRVGKESRSWWWTDQ